MLRVALPFGIGTPEEKRGSYRDALRRAGIEPVEDAADLVGLDGLLLAGGSDVDPGLYHAPREAETDEPDRVRDRLEAALLDQALARDLPVLAICRGLQFLNVRLGGTLRQHIEGHKCPKIREAHAIAIAPASRLESILETRDYVVNSRHHQSAERLGQGLVATAVAPDGVVEALELPSRRFVLGVQWHPEARIDGPDARIFLAFLQALQPAQPRFSIAP
jgi:putative glutamine amidotransferase